MRIGIVYNVSKANVKKLKSKVKKKACNEIEKHAFAVCELPLMTAVFLKF